MIDDDPWKKARHLRRGHVPRARYDRFFDSAWFRVAVVLAGIFGVAFAAIEIYLWLSVADFLARH